MGYSVLGLIYISLSLGLLMNLRTFYPGTALETVNKLLVLAIILSLWVNDTMAYLVGSVIGKTPLISYFTQKNMGRHDRRFYFCCNSHGSSWILF